MDVIVTNPPDPDELLADALAFARQSHQAELTTQATGWVGRLTWDQSLYSSVRPLDDAADDLHVAPTDCGTALCIAGFVTTKLPGYHSEIIQVDGYPLLREWFDERDIYPDVEDDGEDTVNHYERARRALGLTVRQADELFAGNNEIEDVEAAVGWIRASRAARDTAASAAARAEREREDALV